MRLHFLAVVLALLASSALAVFEDEAGQLDWHKQLIGKPTLATFQRVQRRSVVVTATERGVLASLTTTKGTLVWRRLLGDSEEVVNVEPLSNKYFISRSTDSSNSQQWIRSWSSDLGLLAWELSFPYSPDAVNDSFSILPNGYQVLIHGDEVSVIAPHGEYYTQSLPVGSSGVSHVLSSNPQQAYLVQLQGSSAVSTIPVRLSSSSPSEEALTADELKLKHSSSPTGEHVALSHQGIAWCSSSEKLAILWRSESSAAFADSVLDIKNCAEGVKLNLLGSNLERKEHLVLLTSKEGVDEIVHIRKDDSNDKWQLLSSHSWKGRALYSVSLSDKYSAIARISDIETSPSVKILNLDAAQETVLEDIDLGLPRNAHGLLDNAVLDLYQKRDGKIAYRLLLTSEQAVARMVIVDNGRVKNSWIREESLASIVEAEFVELPQKHQLSASSSSSEPESSTNHVEQNIVSSFVSRLLRHIDQFQSFAVDVASLKSLLATRNVNDSLKDEIKGAVADQESDDESSSLDAPLTSSTKNSSSTSSNLYRDLFGYRQLLVAITKVGKVFALDTTSGDQVWSFYDSSLSLPERLIPVSSAAFRTPLVAVTGADKNGHTFIAILDGLTGEVHERRAFDFKATAVLPTQIEDEHHHQLLLVVDPDLKIHRVPESPAAKLSLQKAAPSFYYHIINETSNEIQGFRVTQQDGVFGSDGMWQLRFPGEESIISTSGKSREDHVASLGRVLGNRQVLYKYLNPSTVAIATLGNHVDGDEGASSAVTIYAIDVVSGAILHRAVHVGARGPVPMVLSENWLVYTFWSIVNRRQEVVVWEMYEDARPDMRDLRNEFSSFSQNLPHVLSQTYVINSAVVAAGVTNTLEGITTRLVLFGLGSNQILGINKRFLDPRRPATPLTSDDKEEGLGLLQYDILLPDTPRNMLSYHLEVAKPSKIISSPTALESTSLVAVYGLDLYLTRAAPSKTFDILTDDLNRVSLVGTIVILVISVLVTGYMSKRKALGAQWA